jgi:hypothetical protein
VGDEPDVDGGSKYTLGLIKVRLNVNKQGFVTGKPMNMGCRQFRPIMTEETDGTCPQPTLFSFRLGKALDDLEPVKITRHLIGMLSVHLFGVFFFSLLIFGSRHKVQERHTHTHTHTHAHETPSNSFEALCRPFLSPPPLLCVLHDALPVLGKPRVSASERGLLTARVGYSPHFVPKIHWWLSDRMPESVKVCQMRFLGWVRVLNEWPEC